MHRTSVALVRAGRTPIGYSGSLIAGRKTSYWLNSNRSLPTRHSEDGFIRVTHFDASKCYIRVSFEQRHVGQHLDPQAFPPTDCIQVAQSPQSRFFKSRSAASNGNWLDEKIEEDSRKSNTFCTGYCQQRILVVGVTLLALEGFRPDTC